MRELHFIYNAVMILQLLGIVNEKTKFYNSFKDIIDNSNESLNKVMMYFYEYNYKLIKLNFMFKEYHLDYSIHTNQKINLNYYPLLKKEIDNIMCFMQEINKKILKILKEEVYINDK